jgi:hypothetical protein
MLESICVCLFPVLISFNLSNSSGDSQLQAQRPQQQWLPEAPATNHVQLLAFPSLSLRKREPMQLWRCSVRRRFSTPCSFSLEKKPPTYIVAQMYSEGSLCAFGDDLQFVAMHNILISRINNRRRSLHHLWQQNLQTRCVSIKKLMRRRSFNHLCQQNLQTRCVSIKTLMRRRSLHHLWQQNLQTRCVSIKKLMRRRSSFHHLWQQNPQTKCVSIEKPMRRRSYFHHL